MSFTYADGRADAWEHAAAMLQDMLDKGQSLELAVFVFTSIAADVTVTASPGRVDPRVAGSSDGQHGGHD